MWGAFLEWLQSPESTRRPWGPLFDPRYIGGREPAEILGSLRDHDPVPLAPGSTGPPPTLGQVRRAILSWNEDYHEDFSLSLPARTKHWDDEESQAWEASINTLRRSNDKVSVIMPVRDRESSIAAAIESVRSQTHANWKLLVIDDGSVDRTSEIVREFTRSDERIELLTGSRAGVGVARTLGLDRAEGEYVAFLDSDNEWTPRYLENSLAVLSSDPNVVGTYAALRLHSDGDVIEYQGGPVASSALQKGNCIDINVLVSRTASVREVGGFDLDLKRWVDYDLVLRLVTAGELRYLPFVGCEYANQARGDRITHKESAHWEWVVKEKILSTGPQPMPRKVQASALA